MGSVSSLVNGNSVQEKHCQASDPQLKKGASHQHHPQHHLHPPPARRAGGRSLLSEGLLNCGLGQGSSSCASTRPPAKGLSHSRSGRSEDFFYIKVGVKRIYVTNRYAMLVV